MTLHSKQSNRRYWNHAPQMHWRRPEWALLQSPLTDISPISTSDTRYLGTIGNGEMLAKLLHRGTHKISPFISWTHALNGSHKCSSNYAISCDWNILFVFKSDVLHNFTYFTNNRHFTFNRHGYLCYILNIFVSCKTHVSLMKKLYKDTFVFLKTSYLQKYN